MELEEYLGAKECDQWELFHEDGVFLEKVESIDATFEIYRLYDFFVELTYVPVNEKGL